MRGLNWTEEQIAAFAARIGSNLAQIVKPTLRTHNLTAHQRATGRIRQPNGMNKTEARYGAHLEAQRLIGAVMWYAFEDVTLRIGQDCRYTPDFMVWRPSGFLQFHEVKGRRKNGKAYYEDDARVKIAAAAKQYPMFKFFMVWPGERGEWESKEF